MRVLLFSHTTGYQLRSFNDAAVDLGVDLVFATDRCHQLEDPWQDRAIAVRFHDPESSIRAVLDYARTQPVDGVIAVGDRPVVTAARAAEALGVRWHTVAGARASSDKRQSRAVLAAAGLPSPRFHVHALSSFDASASVATVGFPCVLKPVGLSGSRGVIRANSPAELESALAAHPRAARTPGDSFRARRSRGRDPGRVVYRRRRVRDRRGADRRTAHALCALRQAGSARGSVLRRNHLRDALAGRGERPGADRFGDRSRRRGARVAAWCGPRRVPHRSTARCTSSKSPRGRLAACARACWDSRIARRDVERRRSSDCCSSTRSASRSIAGRAKRPPRP